MDEKRIDVTGAELTPGKPMKLILDNGEVYEFKDWDAVVLDSALVAFNAAKENISYFDEKTRRDVYASYERLRAVIPFFGQD